MKDLTVYNTIRDDLQTGDIVLFSGGGSMSTVIKIGTFSKISHVGMVVRLPGCDFVGLLESTTLSTIQDIKTCKYVKGVQLVGLKDRLLSYNGSVYIRPILKAGIIDLDSKVALEFYREFQGRAYEKSRKDLAGSAIQFLSDDKEDLSSVFCSELIAEYYQRIGLLDESKPSDEYDPADFSVDGNIDLLYGKLGKQIQII